MAAWDALADACGPAARARAGRDPVAVPIYIAAGSGHRAERGPAEAGRVVATGFAAVKVRLG